MTQKSNESIKYEAPPVGGSKWFTHLPFWGGRGSWKFMLSSNLLKSKIPMLRLGGGGSWKLMLSSNLLKSKIPMLGGGEAHGN